MNGGLGKVFILFKPMELELKVGWKRCQQSYSIAYFSLGPAPRLSHVIYACVFFLSVCLCLYVSPPPPEAWTFWYLLDTLDLKVPFEPLGTS